MKQTLIVLSLAGALSYGPILPDVGRTRQTLPTKYPISPTIDIDAYRCHLALPYGYGHLIGREAVFISDDGLVSPVALIVDVQQKAHRGGLEKAGLLADISCFSWVHQYGRIYLVPTNGIH